MKNAILSVILLATCVTSFGQSRNISLNGVVVGGENNDVLPFATVSVTNNANQLIDGGITDENGIFQLSVPPNTYSISVEYIGFETLTINAKPYANSVDLGSLQLTYSIESLEGIDVIGESAEVEIRLDKRVYNVAKNNITKGGTVSDVLENVPSVSVDIDGEIELRGNTNVRILVDGKPSGLGH